MDIFILMPCDSLEHLPVEFVLCAYYLEHLAGRKDSHEFRMVALLQLFHLEITGIHHSDGFLASPLIIGVNVMIPAHLVEERTLLFLQFGIDREELLSLIRGESCLGRDKLLHLCLKTSWVKLSSLWGLCLHEESEQA
jgi:hypothetical protein